MKVNTSKWIQQDGSLLTLDRIANLRDGQEVYWSTMKDGRQVPDLFSKIVILEVTRDWTNSWTATYCLAGGDDILKFNCEAEREVWV